MLDRILEVLTGSQWIQDKLQRNEHVIRLLKQLGLDPDHPPTDFEGVYNYALVEYGVDKPRPCLEIFRAKEIQQAFRTAFDQNNAQLWLESGDQFLASSAIGDAVAAIGLDPQRELALFAAQFVTVAKRTRHAGDVLLSHQVADVQQSVRRMAGQLETLASQGAILPGRGAAIAGSDPALLPPSACRAAALGQQMRGWFETLGYRFEAYEVWQADYFEWVINIPVRRGRYDRVLVRGVAGEVGIQEVRSLCESVAAQKTDEGWVVTDRRISQAARGELAKLEASEDAGLAAFTWDELLDQDADFSSYVDWLTAEIERRGIEAKYVPLACTKEEVDPSTHQRLGVSRYGAADGWTEGYIDRWLDDPAKEHLSILGEFGTGKTWLTLHYAAQALRAYREAQAKGMNRPRLPIVIPLRDYAKAVSVESLFSEFFFRKHEIPIPGYSAFEQLNRMGKLLLIFDGFDEMAARVDKQQMINNFWELAKVVVPGSKVVLTCRTEHFPEAREGRALLNAELQASTKDLTGETPQFEVLELEKFEDDQIRQVLALQASEGTVAQVLGNPQLLDLARRPVMTELILEALPEIEAGKPVDMSRVYLYAVKRKMERDIKAERTFTSMADKLYFLCELSWEMLSSDRMSINYREFPDRIRKLFGAAVQEEKDLDHWHYDMMGQTMLIRNADGDYSPAHRSLLEFFVAFKFAAELGALAPDFLELAQMKSGIDRALEPREYSWSEYFGGGAVAPLSGFRTESLEGLRDGFGKIQLPKALLDLILPILRIDAETILYLKNLLNLTRGKLTVEASYTGGNAVTILTTLDSTALENQDLSHTVIQAANFTMASLLNTNLSHANLKDSVFIDTFGLVLSAVFTSDDQIIATGGADGIIRLWNITEGKQELSFRAHPDWVSSLAFTSDDSILISGGHEGKIKLWNPKTEKCLATLNGHTASVRSISLSPVGTIFASCGDDQTIRLWDVNTGECLKVLRGHTDRIWAVAIAPSGRIVASSSFDQTIRLWDVDTAKCLMAFQEATYSLSIAFSDDSQILATSSGDSKVNLWDVNTGQLIRSLEGHDSSIRVVVFNRGTSILASGSSDQMIKLWNINTGECLKTIDAHNERVRTLSFNSSGTLLASSSADHTVKFWDILTGKCLKTLYGGSRWVESVAFSPDGKFIAIGSNDKTIRLLDIDSEEYLQVLKGHQKWVSSTAISPDGKLIASGSGDGTVRLWNIYTGQCLKIFQEHTNRIKEIGFNLHGNIIVSSSDDGTVKLWNTLTGECLKTFRREEKYKYMSNSIALSPDSKTLAISRSDYTIRLFDINSEELLNVFEGHNDRIWSLAISPDGKKLASGCRDQTGKVWDIATGICIQTLNGHTEGVDAIAFNHNGELLLTGGMDQLIKLWDVDSGECLRTFEGHMSRVRCVCFSPNGKTLVSGSYDETVKLWDVESGQCLKTFKNTPYEGMNITGVKGLTPATIASLKALGAIDDNDPGGEP